MATTRPCLSPPLVFKEDLEDKSHDAKLSQTYRGIVAPITSNRVPSMPPHFSWNENSETSPLATLFCRALRPLNALPGRFVLCRTLWPFRSVSGS